MSLSKNGLSASGGTVGIGGGDRDTRMRHAAASGERPLPRNGGRRPKTPDPTPAEIRQRAEAIQEEWSEATRLLRLVSRPAAWSPPRVRLCDDFTIELLGLAAGLGGDAYGDAAA